MSYLVHEPIRLVDTKTAAEIIGIQPRTLEGYRFRGGGPIFVRVSPRCVRYRLSDIQSWLLSKNRTSTSTELAKGSVNL